MKQLSKLLPTLEGEPVAFADFWNAYPRKQDKAKAEKAFARLSEADKLAAIRGALHHAESNPQWRDKTLIPHPTTFINGRRWQDEIVISRREEINRDGYSGDLPKMVWSALTQMYGTVFTNRHGDTPPPVWKRQIMNCTPDEIAHGLRLVTDMGEEYPPAMPKFIELCKRPKNTLPEFAALPRPEGNPDLADKAFAEIWQILKR